MVIQFHFSLMQFKFSPLSHCIYIEILSRKPRETDLSFKVDICATLDEKVADIGVSIMSCYVERREPTLKMQIFDEILHFIKTPNDNVGVVHEV